MRKLLLTDYTEKVRDENGVWTDVPYQVVDSLVELLQARDLQLNGRALLDRHQLAEKVAACKEDTILLEEEEWGKLVQSADTVRGLGRTDAELMKRIYNAEQVDVEEKKPDQNGPQRPRPVK